MNLVKHLRRQKEWSEKTFGPGARTAGVLDHIRKELFEIEAAPDDPLEWADLIILAFDGAWRAGLSPNEICEAIMIKQAINEQRDWPDWRTLDPNKAIEHCRRNDDVMPKQKFESPLSALIKGVSFSRHNFSSSAFGERLMKEMPSRIDEIRRRRKGGER